MEILSALREKNEKGLTVLSVIPIHNDWCVSIYVLLVKRNVAGDSLNRYYLFRYSKIGSFWELRDSMKNTNLNYCLERITKDCDATCQKLVEQKRESVNKGYSILKISDRKYNLVKTTESGAGEIGANLSYGLNEDLPESISNHELISFAHTKIISKNLSFGQAKSLYIFMSLGINLPDELAEFLLSSDE